ncbi:hypothetical protein M9458_047170, partial [Cirrhinus mrigala]
SRLCPPQPGQKSFLPITCVHGDTQQVPARRVTISAPHGAWPVEAGLMKDLPVPVLLGRDWPGFDHLLAATTQPTSPRGNRRRRRRPRGPRRRPALLASDSGRDGESPSQNTNLFYDVFQQATGGGSFAKEQREDDRLKHCWAQVRAIDNKDILPQPHPLPHFIVRKGLLYCVAQRRREEKELLVVPRTKTETILELAHSHPMAGHLGAANTIQRILDRFHWPGLEADVKKKATAKAIAQELFLLANRVGIPEEILTDQGTPFVSRLMADLCTLLRVIQLRTTVYHPQTDGLMERFNATLKKMLRPQLVSPPSSSCLAVKLGGSWTPPRKLGSSSLPPTARSERIDQIMPLVREHLSKAQQAQQRHYNRAAQPREFQPGDPVMVLVPTSACKFLASWQGPYTVVEKVGPVTYRLRQPGRRQNEQLYHINLLKKWNGTRDQVAALSLTDPVVVNVNPHLSAAQKAELVGQFSDVFSSRPGQTNVIQHDIRTPPGVIVRQWPYRVPEAHRQAIEEEVQEMLKLGVIEPSRSPWSSPIVMVPKPDDTLRFCNDFRRLNEVSEFDSYPMPRVDELLDRLGRARYISTLDLTKGYWQVPLTPSAKLKTVFSTPSGHWQYRTLPFGLHGAPATFQRMMDIILRPHQACVAAYLDDVVVHSKAWEDHLDRLRRVLSELKRAGLTTNPHKCHLALSEAKYLGFQVGRGLIHPQEKLSSPLPSPRRRP